MNIYEDIGPIFKCQKCGYEMPIEEENIVVMDDNSTISACNDCVADFHFEKSEFKKEDRVDVLEELQLKVSEMKDQVLFRDEEMIVLLQSAIYEIKGLRAAQESVSEALNSGDGAYRP